MALNSHLYRNFKLSDSEAAVLSTTSFALLALSQFSSAGGTFLWPERRLQHCAANKHSLLRSQHILYTPDGNECPPNALINPLTALKRLFQNVSRKGSLSILRLRCEAPKKLFICECIHTMFTDQSRESRIFKLVT